MSTYRDAALAYARLGWSVGPLHEWRNERCTCGKGADCGTPAKHPRWMADVFEHGLHSATTDPELIMRLWRRYPTAGVFRRPGEHDVCLDVDPRSNGDDALHELERTHGMLPPTQAVTSGSGGVHFYFTSATRLRGTTIARQADLYLPQLTPAGP
jgi:hypothetical protein